MEQSRLFQDLFPDPDRLSSIIEQAGLSTLLRPGDTVLAGELTYPGMKGIAQMLGLRIRGVAMDEEGLRPDALDVACRESSPKALYCVPTIQSPTCAIMSQERRQYRRDQERRGASP